VNRANINYKWKVGSLKNESDEAFGKIKVTANCTFEVAHEVHDALVKNEIEEHMQRGLDQAVPHVE